MSKCIAAIPLSSISRLSLVEAGGRSMAQVKEALGCQYIINSWFYNMNTGKAVGNLCIDGEVKARAGWAGYGLTWDTGPDIRMEVVPGAKAGRSYLSGVELLTPTRGPEEPASYSAEYGGKRGRSAALLAGDYLILYCSGDGTADAKTPEAMRDELVELARENATPENTYVPIQEQIDQAVGQSTGSMSREEMESTLQEALTSQASLDESQVEDYIAAMSDEELSDLFTQMAEEQFKAQYAAQVQQQLAAMEPAQMAAALDAAMDTYTTQQCAQYYDEVLTFSDSTYEENLVQLGYIDLEDPASISLYAASFEDKDVIEQAIADYNETKDDLEQIQYTDYIGLMLSSITTIINAITYVLIAFVAVSLVVSSIMIGVITLISVQERTKEIGILRAIGASKRNVSSMFNAETVIIGFTSGALGVLITWVLCIPINAILHHLTGIQTLSAFLPLPTALVLVLISTALTLFSGIIPSRSAAKKDPVVALRTE